MKLGQRALIIGKSGSGKSVLAQNILLDTIKANPEADVLIINHKNEGDLNRLLEPERKIPKRFEIGDRMNIVPLFGDKDDEAAVDKLLHDVYRNGDKPEHKGTIVLVDEGLMINPRNIYMLALQTQGRSKNISVITLSQRPKFISLFAVTQASEIHIFNIMGKDDIKTLENVVRPKTQSLESYVDAMPPYHYCTYYDDKPDLIVNKPLPFPVRGKIGKKKKSLPKKKVAIAALAGIALLTKSLLH